MKIFISIASYQDPLLMETVCSAYKNAINKENLRFGICDQSDQGIEINKLKFKNQIEYEHIDPVISRGPCWARERIQHFFNGEDYYLQIDSHTIFSYGWDALLIKYHQWIDSDGSNKLVITGYPRSFKPNSNLDSFEINSSYKETLGIAFSKDGIFQDQHYSQQIGISTNSKNPVKGLLIAAGFMFASGEFVTSIPYDSRFYFHGEELGIAVRIFTNGWTVAHIPRIPLFHYYTDVHNLTRKLHWDSEDEKNRAIKWKQLDNLSKTRLSDLINNRIDGMHGLGSDKSIEEFSSLCGLDLKNKLIIDLNSATNGLFFEKIEQDNSCFESVEILND